MATSYDLNVTRGSNFSVRLSVKDEAGASYDLSGYSASGSAKCKYSSSGNLIELNPVIVSGYGGTAYESGLIDIVISGDMTTGLPIIQGVYDVEIYSGTLHQKVINGFINIYPEVTRDEAASGVYTASGTYF